MSLEDRRHGRLNRAEGEEWAELDSLLVEALDGGLDDLRGKHADVPLGDPLRSGLRGSSGPSEPRSSPSGPYPVLRGVTGLVYRQGTCHRRE